MLDSLLSGIEKFLHRNTTSCHYNEFSWLKKSGNIRCVIGGLFLLTSSLKIFWMESERNPNPAMESDVREFLIQFGAPGSDPFSWPRAWNIFERSPNLLIKFKVRNFLKGSESRSHKVCIRYISGPLRRTGNI